jgi:hypothetical protein
MIEPERWAVRMLGGGRGQLLGEVHRRASFRWRARRFREPCPAA